jgi:adenylate cyclase
VTGLARLIRRNRAFVNWVIRTRWPVFALAVMEPNIIGGLFVLGFLRFGLPREHRVILGDLPSASLPFFIAVVLLALTVESLISLKLLIPVFRWQRGGDESLGGDDAVATELARTRALKMPFYRALIGGATWCLGGIILIIPIWGVVGHFKPVLAVAAALGATASSIIGYLQAERVLRPVAVAALRQGVPEHFHPPGVITRTVLSWLLSTGVPVLAIVVTIVTTKLSITQASADELFMPILLLAIAALVIGLTGTVLTAMSIADPLRELRWALGEVQRGNYNVHMKIYDASALGLLQAGFNDMVRGLSERHRLRDLFGRYVGEDVARRALERRPELGGQECTVAVLFVDLVGSTTLAATSLPAEVVSRLNEFFQIVVETVNRHGGFVNKFQGDAALAIFGAPLQHPDASGAALAAARELHDELIKLPSANEFGIGVSAGRVIAGHIGAQARFEYTVIGDPVNEAARLTELAKLEEGHVLASAIAVSGAQDGEALCWDVGENVELPGRTESTQLARPVKLVVPSEV